MCVNTQLRASVIILTFSMALKGFLKDIMLSSFINLHVFPTKKNCSISKWWQFKHTKGTIKLYTTSLKVSKSRLKSKPLFTNLKSSQIWSFFKWTQAGIFRCHTRFDGKHHWFLHVKHPFTVGLNIFNCIWDFKAIAEVKIINIKLDDLEYSANYICDCELWLDQWTS